MPRSKDPKLARAGVSGYNKPKRTPNHPTKKFVVVAKEGDKTKTIRFGDAKMKIKKDQPARRKSFRARHRCDTSPPKLRRKQCRITSQANQKLSPNLSPRKNQ